MQDIRFAINRTVAPQIDLDRFLNLAADAGISAVEIRSDIEGQEFANGMPPGELSERLEERGIAIASINALQRFNDWTAEREKEAVALISYAGACGAPGLVLCPVVSADDGRSEGQLAADLRRSLKALAPILTDHGVVGLVEPLGMVDSTLRHKRPAVEALADVDAGPAFSLCHDTFQHYRASDPDVFPELTGMVHISGVTNRSLPRTGLLEAHRGFVDRDDIVDNVEHIRIMIGAGYSGYFSFEPFDPAVQAMADPTQALRESVAYVRDAYKQAIAA